MMNEIKDATDSEVIINLLELLVQSNERILRILQAMNKEGIEVYTGDHSLEVHQRYEP